MKEGASVKKRDEQTRRLLAEIRKGSFEASSAEELRDVLRFHEQRYYILNDPLISDTEYDILFKKLQELEESNPDLIVPESPTQRVAVGLTKDFPTVQHLVPMLSLDNSYNSDDLISFDKKAREITGLKEIEYCVEPKFDGASISLVYENNRLVRGATRGDGTKGDDITPNIKQIRTVPLYAPFSEQGLHTVEIRGEVLITKENFKKFNEALAEQGGTPLANPRNAASGTLRIKDPAEVRRRKLEVFMYHVSYYNLEKGGEELQTHSQTLDLLASLGFRTPAGDKKVFKGIEKVIEFCKKYEEGRDALPYEIDGLVIKVNDFELQDKLGMTSHHPRWAIAYKYAARQATSKLLRVEYQVGRTGNIGPVAKIEPVPLGGVVVSSASLFNEDYITQKDIRIGDTVLVERAGDVIPQIVKPLTELRTGKEEKIVFPQTCPSCGDKLVRVQEEAAWRCVNDSCPAQMLEKLMHFASKDAMDIRGLGAALIKKFVNLGLLSSIPGIYTLDFEAIGELEGFGSRSIEKLRTSIEASKSQPLHRLLFALGIRFVGETMAKTVTRNISHLMDLKDFSEADLLKLEDVGPKVAASIQQFFANEDNLQMISDLEGLGLNLHNIQSSGAAKEGDGKLEGKSFLFTGTLSKLKRSEAEAAVEAQGGTILSGVSSKLDYLVVGEDAGSKLEKAKRISTIHIISEDQFIKMAEIQA